MIHGPSIIFPDALKKLPVDAALMLSGQTSKVSFFRIDYQARENAGDLADAALSAEILRLYAAMLPTQKTRGPC